MTKLRDPLSAPGAFGRSIYLLRPDPTTKKDGIERASLITGLAVKTLHQALDPKPTRRPLPIDIRAAEALDAVHLAEQGIAHNFEAWIARREAAGAVSLGPEPERILERALSDIHDATRAIKAGRGDLADADALIADLQSALADLSRARIDRARAERAKPLPPARLIKGGDE